MRFSHVALVAAAAMVVGCGGDGGSDDEGRPGRDVGEVVEEPGPEPLVGQTDTDPEHWDEGEAWDPPFGSTSRAYGGDVWSTVADFPQSTNGCDGAQRRVTWRSLGEPLYAAVTSYASDGEQSFATPEAPVENTVSDGWVDVGADEPATEGEMVMNACEQPVFRTTEANLLGDFVVEVTEHAPAV